MTNSVRCAASSGCAAFFPMSRLVQFTLELKCRVALNSIALRYGAS